MKIAAVTNVYDEREFLPIWQAHYGRIAGLSNLYIIDDGSTDGSTDGLAPSWVIRRPKSLIDQFMRSAMISHFVARLLALYDVVIYTDVDEMLVVDPLAGLSFSTYLTRVAGRHLNAIGFNVLHNQFEEPPYDPAVPLLHTRQWLQFEHGYCKQLVHRTPVIFSPGFHLTNKPVNYAPGLYLLHLRAFDVGISLRRIEHRRRLAWAKRSTDHGHGVQNRMTPDEYLHNVLPYGPEQFAVAEPADRFNQFVLTRVEQLQQMARMPSPAAQGLPPALVRRPERFADVISSPADRFALPAEPVAVEMSTERLEEMFELSVAASARDTAVFGPMEVRTRAR